MSCAHISVVSCAKLVDGFDANSSGFTITVSLPDSCSLQIPHLLLCTICTAFFFACLGPFFLTAFSSAILQPLFNTFSRRPFNGII